MIMQIAFWETISGIICHVRSIVHPFNWKPRSRHFKRFLICVNRVDLSWQIGAVRKFIKSFRLEFACLRFGDDATSQAGMNESFISTSFHNSFGSQKQEIHETHDSSVELFLAQIIQFIKHFSI